MTNFNARMAASLRPAVLAVLGLFFAPLAIADIVNGSSRADVVAELGKPLSTAQRGPVEILNYPKKVKIELENGVVVDIRGYTPAGVTLPTATAAKEEKPTTAPSTPASEPSPAKKTPPKKPEKNEEDEDVAASNPAVGANLLGDKVEKMNTAWGDAPVAPKKKAFDLPELLVGLALHFVLTIVGLRLAFKYWEMDAFWSGTFAIASIDTVIKGIMEGLDPITQGFSTLGHVDAAVAWLVMIGTIRHFCFNKRIQNAVLTAAFVKTAVTIIYIFAHIALYQAVKSLIH